MSGGGGGGDSTDKDDHSAVRGGLMTCTCVAVALAAHSLLHFSCSVLLPFCSAAG